MQGDCVRAPAAWLARGLRAARTSCWGASSTCRAGCCRSGPPTCPRTADRAARRCTGRRRRTSTSLAGSSSQTRNPAHDVLGCRGVSGGRRGAGRLSGARRATRRTPAAWRLARPAPPRPLVVVIQSSHSARVAKRREIHKAAILRLRPQPTTTTRSSPTQPSTTPSSTLSRLHTKYQKSNFLKKKKKVLQPRF